MTGTANDKQKYINAKQSVISYIRTQQAVKETSIFYEAQQFAYTYIAIYRNQFLLSLHTCIQALQWSNLRHRGFEHPLHKENFQCNYRTQDNWSPVSLAPALHTGPGD